MNVPAAISAALSAHEGALVEAVGAPLAWEVTPHGRATLTTTGRLVAGFGLATLPRCRAVLVSHSAEVATGFRNRGIGAELQRVRLDAAQLANVGAVLATTRADNTVQNRIMVECGAWQQVITVKNPSTGALVHLWLAGHLTP
jgi:hypothetical protein